MDRHERSGIEDSRPELVKKRFRAIFVTRVVVGIVIFMVLLIVGMMAWNLKLANDQRDLMAGCATPGHPCYEDSLSRQDDVIRRIAEEGQKRQTVTRELIAVAAACAGDRRWGTINEIELCIQIEMQKRTVDEDG